MRRATHARLAISPAWRAVKCHLSAAILASASRWGLDKNLVGISRQCDDFLDVPLIVGEVARRSDFLPRRCAQGVLFEVTERYD